MAKWTGVVTNKGAELLAAWAEGTTLNIYSAAAGTGTVAEAAMIAQTALAGQKQAASIVSHSKADGATGLKIQLQITAPSTGYTLNQFGIWAKVGSGEGKLLALFQNSEGIDVPSASDSPDFVYTFYGLIMISNTGSISVTVDASAVVTTATMQAAIAAAIADIPQPIIGTTPPTTSTVGVVGQEYIDKTNKRVWYCTAAKSTGYTWILTSAGLSTKVNTTLSASGWSTAKKYTVSNANITATSAVELLPRENNGITQAQMEALSGAMIVGGTQAAGSIQLVALGDKPTTDIPVTLIIRRDL
nr:MAG TPA: tail-collar fiber protein [Caudoviricetes sp.]